MADENRRDRRGLEHDPAARRDAGPDGLVPLDKQKVRLSLGEEIERFGAVSAVHRAAAVKAVREMASAARRSRVASLDVFLTAPGRQASNAAELVAALSRAAGVQARVLTKEEEGTLAYRGAVLTAGHRAAVAGRRLRHRRRVDRDRRRPAGRRVPTGSNRSISARFASPRGPATCSRRPRTRSPTWLRRAVEAVLAVGGSARAARRLVGSELGEDGAGRGAPDRRDELGARDRPALRRRPRARRHPPGRGHPARGGAAEARGLAPRLRRRHPRGRRPRLARRARGVATAPGSRARSGRRPARTPRPSSGRDRRAPRRRRRACSRRFRPRSSRSRRGGAFAFPEPDVLLELHSERGGERLDRLDAADVRARDDAPHSERPQELDEIGGLPPPARIERAQMVLVLPVAGAPGGGVAQQDARHRRSSRGRSRGQLSRLAASSGVSQAISSTSAWDTNSPATGRMRQ